MAEHTHTASINGLTPEKVRALLLAGYRTSEIAAMCGARQDLVSNFVSAHGLSLLLEPGDRVPPPHRGPRGELVIYRTTVESTTCNRRMHRITLPSISMHLAALGVQA